MKASYKINPLFLLIMAQAWCHVKHDNDFNVLNKSQIIPPFPQNVKNLISPQVWEYVWSHPFFSSSNHTLPPLSIRQLSRQFGVNDNFPAISNKDDAIDLLFKIKEGECDPRAIKISWNEDFEKEVPKWVIDLLNIEKSNPQVWMDVLPSQKINENSCNRSIQLGWSWWLTPPDKVAGFKDYFEKYKPLMRYWFINPLSDQWVWPWCDILTKSLTEKFLGFEQERYWILNNNQKNAWLSLDDEVFSEFEKSIGGPDICQSYIYSVLHELNKVNFLDRNF